MAKKRKLKIIGVKLYKGVNIGSALEGLPMGDPGLFFFCDLSQNRIFTIFMGGIHPRLKMRPWS